jgi:hypothetical protein
MIQQIHEFVVGLLTPVYWFLIPYWDNFIIFAHRMLDPICVETAHYDIEFNMPPCTAAKFFTLIALHVPLFFFLARNTDRKTPRVLDQHSVLVFPEDEPAPAVVSKKKAERVSDGLAQQTGLRLRGAGAKALETS